MLYDSEQGDIEFALAGDALINRRVSVFREPRFLALIDLVRAADVSITNVETLFHDFENSPGVVPGGSYIHSDPRMIDELSWMGFDMVAAANNHNYDYGEAGLLTHIRHLRKSGIAFAGIGENMGQARAPRYLDTPAGRVALISVTSTGPQALYAQHQWREGKGRPGANMIRYTTRYTVDREIFAALRRMRDELGLTGHRTLSSGFKDHSLGASRIPDTETEFFLGDLHSEWQYPVPNGYRIALGDRCSVELIPDSADLEENLQRIRDARRMADWVVVSMHNHESGAAPEDPSNVARTFAHAAIEAGADVFHGHGPHRDRGIEIVDGHPIFYSIGHFIGHNETVERQALDGMLRQGLPNPWEATPADFYDARSGREWMGEWLPQSYGSRPDVWRDVLALVEFTDHRLTRLRLQPIDLGFGLARSERGRPMMADDEVSREVIEHFARLSEPFGTKITALDGVGMVEVQ